MTYHEFIASEKRHQPLSWIEQYAPHLKGNSKLSCAHFMWQKGIENMGWFLSDGEVYMTDGETAYHPDGSTWNARAFGEPLEGKANGWEWGLWITGHRINCYDLAIRWWQAVKERGRDPWKIGR